MRLRKNWLALTTAERNTYLQAVLTLKNTVANPGAPVAQRYSIYDQFVLIHQALAGGQTPFSGESVDLGHGGWHFLPWHRKFLIELEDALNAAVPGQNIAIPYWDWTDYAGTLGELLVDTAFGPNGTGPAMTVSSGYFAPTAPVATPPWWPSGLTGWNCQFVQDGLPNGLVRNIVSAAAVATQIQVRDIILQLGYFIAPDLTNRATWTGLWIELEFGPHGAGHNWFSSPIPGTPFAHMSHMFISPNDPMFFLHHSQVDRVWAMWQRDGHEGVANYEPGVAFTHGYGHLATHALFPWFGSATGWSSPITTDPTIDFPDFSGQPATTIGDMLDHRALGYAYDTEPVVGLALDRTGSMTGVTPDPVTGMSSTMTKWEVASEGVANFLQDCEAARDAGEAIVTAGVETFRSTGGANEFDKVLTPDFAVVRTGSTSSRAAFEMAIDGITPSGGTPIAGALLDTENTLVRPPYSGLPTGDTRYLSILTDGIETAAPDLSTVSTGQLTDTIIFAMGFGVGSGWDGVDYTMIQTITQKGKTPPFGIDPVYHGENAGVVNKFYTDSVAAAIGYTPTTDPVTELVAGHQTSVPFSAGPAERSFLIAIQGFDGNASAWQWALLGPDGTVYDGASPGSLAITEKRNGGRITLFVHRNGTDDAKWNGVWLLLVGYKTKTLRTDPKALRMGRDRIDMLLPGGVGMPLAGPRFANANKPPPEPPIVATAMAMPTMTLMSLADGSILTADHGPRERSTVSVDIYARTAMPSALHGTPSDPYAGATIKWVLQLDTLGQRTFTGARVVANLVRPGYQIGRAYLDQKTIPLDQRKAFVDDNGRFDEVAFLAAYEAKHPNAFPLIREAVEFEPVDNGVFVAKIGKTPFPGPYRMAVVASAEAALPGQDSHHLFRTLNASTGLGIRLDDKASDATWHWRDPREAEIVVTPQDRLRNIPSPARMPSPVVEINGKPVDARHVNDWSGRHVLVIDFKGGKGAVVDATGCQVTGKGTHVAGLGGGKVELRPDEPLQATLRIGNQTLSVLLPQRIARVGSKVALPAAHKNVLEWPVDERIAFATAQDAFNSGFEPTDD